jgi:hypothetical protein
MELLGVPVVPVVQVYLLPSQVLLFFMQAGVVVECKGLVRLA